MSDSTHNSHQDSGPTRPDDDRYIPSADQDVASGQPYDPRMDPETDADLGQDEAGDEDSDKGGDDDSAEAGEKFCGCQHHSSMFGCRVARAPFRLIVNGPAESGTCGGRMRGVSTARMSARWTDVGADEGFPADIRVLRRHVCGEGGDRGMDGMPATG